MRRLSKLVSNVWGNHKKRSNSRDKVKRRGLWRQSEDSGISAFRQRGVRKPLKTFGSIRANNKAAAAICSTALCHLYSVFLMTRKEIAAK